MSRSGPPTCSRTPTPPLPPPPLLHALEPVHEQHGRRVVGPARTRSPLRRRRPHRRYYTLGGCYARAPRMQRLPARVPVRARCSGERPGPRVCSRNSVGLVREMTGSGSTSRWCIQSHSVRCAVVSGEHKVGSSVGVMIIFIIRSGARCCLHAHFYHFRGVLPLTPLVSRLFSCMRN